jgi:ATP-dependent DNA helicase PIF1
MRNLNLSEGLSNGTRLFINKVSRHVIDVEILTGKNKGKNVFIPRITIMPDESECPFPFKRQQFPVKLAFGLTINKSQGQTINKLGLFIDSRLFYHGHLYTAMSRVSEKNALKIMLKKSTVK